MDARAPGAARPLMNLWQRHSFRVHIAVAFSALMLGAGAVLVWTQYLQGRAVVLSAAEDVFERMEREVRGEILSLRSPVEAVVDWLSRSPLVDAESDEERMASLPAMAEVLDRNTMLESVYAGYYNGDFFQLYALRTDAERARAGAPRHAAYRLQTVERALRRTRFRLLDSALNVIAEVSPPPGYSFDPRERPWYVDALASTDLVQTPPYVFYTTREVGQTFARRAEHGRAVIGADMTLRRLASLLAVAKPTPSSQVVVFDEQGAVIAHSGEAQVPHLNDAGVLMQETVGESFPAVAAAGPKAVRDASPATVAADGREWLVRVVPSARMSRGETYLGVATPTDELLAAAHAGMRRSGWIALALVLLAAPLAWWLAHRIAANLNALSAQAAAIRRFDFRPPEEPVKSRIIEVNELSLAMERMRETIGRFTEITTALAAERDIGRLLRRVLVEARAAAGAEAGVLYLLDEEAGRLDAGDQSWEAWEPGALPPALPLGDAEHPVVQALRSGSPHRLQPIAHPRPKGLEYLDARFGEVPVTLVTVPLRERSGTVIGVLCLFTHREAPSEVRLALVDAFAAAGAVAIHNQRLLASRKAMFDALIRLIAGAIDAKSAYTAGHCQRVPELTCMLTRAACEQKSGPFADFDLDDAGWEALQIAGGLHDCGKVTTPEYVVDKATKLETIYDRIHEVRMRFEVLKRDAEISYLKAVLAGGDEPALRARMEEEWRTLDEEFAFIAECNVGSEFLPPEKIERIGKIASRTWTRTLDDRLGISWEEAERKARTPPAPLPVAEPLLADRPDHLIERRAADILPEPNPWGFRVETPKYLYNRGEIYNLSIPRGTLTEEERYKINDHIVQTIIMLSALPLPPHLRSVPEIAGGHHERMDGRGYPRRLKRNDMSVPARIMAIADIFEALTASDRPYKKAKKLSEAIRIMAGMKKDGHIDPDLFDLFLTSGVWREYAARFMDPRYIDDVDVEAFLSTPAPA